VRFRMTDSEHIAHIRLHSQQLAGTNFKSVKDLVGFMGGMQAQDYAMSKWAVGVRLAGVKDADVEQAVAAGEIIRTHVLRPTWHLVSADDIRWMLELSAPQIRTAMQARHRQLELTDAVVLQSNALMERALSGGNHLTREELVAVLDKAGMRTDENRAAHFLLRAELDGVICSGASRGKKQTYALLAERVPKTESPSREEALAKLARKYFSGHCPATLRDFIWWSGLSVTTARHALELVKSDYLPENVDGCTYWLPSSYSLPCNDCKAAFFLPAYDEFLIGYTDRRASLPSDKLYDVVSTNGIFRPVIVINGQVAGLWKRTVKKETVIIETDLFQAPGKAAAKALIKAAAAYGRFLGMDAELRNSRNA
jgi:hypothetical protein